jgi:hypothetical protein
MAQAPQVERVFDRFGCVALVFYTAISVFVFARSLLPDFADSYVGQGPDPSLFIWSLVWWPHAIAHRLNPFLTHAIFAPAGVNLAWRPQSPLASLLVSPITVFFGPVVAYNILFLASPPLAAWTAFLLCRHIARSYWPAILGGYIFGFSAYMLGHTLAGHLNLVLVFAVPLAVYLVALWLEGALKPLKFVALMGLTLAVQFTFSVEIFATMTVFGAMAIVLALAFTEGETRRRIGRMLVPVASSCVFAALLVSPCLYYMFAYPELRGPVWSLEAFSADVLNFLIPTETSALGHLPVANSISLRFPGNIFERDAFVGPALLAVIAAYAWRHWRQPFGKLLIDSLIIICVLSLGPFLHFGGHLSGPLPGKLFAALPAIEKALPVRFMMYAFLIIAIITSLWFTTSTASNPMKYTAAAAIVLFSLPNFSSRYWASKVDTPAFFLRGLYRQYLAPNENLLVLPYFIFGNSMLWQGQTDMYFRMAGGWIGPLPDEYQLWPIVNALAGPTYVPDARAQLMSFLSSHDVEAIVVGDNDPDRASWRSLLAPLAVPPLEIGGVTLYRIPPETLARYGGMSPVEAERRADRTLFNTLLAAAWKYAAEGRHPGELTPLRAKNLNLLPADWLTGPSWVPARLAATAFDPTPSLETRLAYGVFLGRVGKTYFGVGVMGTYDALKPLIDDYRRDAYRIFFPAPRILAPEAEDEGRGLLLMVFDTNGLARAETKAAASLSGMPRQSRIPAAARPEGGTRHTLDATRRSR